MQGDPILMQNKLFILKPWNPEVGNVCGSIRVVPVWVQFHNIPIFAWSHLGINWLACRLGRLVCMDDSTEKLERLRYAKCLIEVTPDNELVDSFEVRLVDGGTQRIEVRYLWKPDVCTTCKVFGHPTEQCAPASKVKSSEDVQIAEKEINCGGRNNETAENNPKLIRRQWFTINKQKRKLQKGRNNFKVGTAAMGKKNTEHLEIPILSTDCYVKNNNGNEMSKFPLSDNVSANVCVTNSFSELETIEEEQEENDIGDGLEEGEYVKHQDENNKSVISDNTMNMESEDNGLSSSCIANETVCTDSVDHQAKTSDQGSEPIIHTPILLHGNRNEPITEACSHAHQFTTALPNLSDITNPSDDIVLNVKGSTPPYPHVNPPPAWKEPPSQPPFTAKLTSHNPNPFPPANSKKKKFRKSRKENCDDMNESTSTSTTPIIPTSIACNSPNTRGKRNLLSPPLF